MNFSGKELRLNEINNKEKEGTCQRDMMYKLLRQDRAPVINKNILVMIFILYCRSKSMQTLARFDFLQYQYYHYFIHHSLLFPLLFLLLFLSPY